MKCKNESKGILLNFLVNILMNLEWLLPALVLLALHFWLGWPIWLFWFALAAWVVGIFISVFLLSWISKHGNIQNPPKENKNPYSKRNKQ